MKAAVKNLNKSWFDRFIVMKLGWQPVEKKKMNTIRWWLHVLEQLYLKLCLVNCYLLVSLDNQCQSRWWWKIMIIWSKKEKKKLCQFDLKWKYVSVQSDLRSTVQISLNVSCVAILHHAWILFQNTGYVQRWLSQKETYYFTFFLLLLIYRYAIIPRLKYKIKIHN